MWNWVRGNLPIVWLVLIGGVLSALGAFVEVPSWDANYEAKPYDSDPVREGNEELQGMKGGVRERFAVQHQFGDGVDTGFHKNGSAWALVESDCTAVAIDPDHEDGRLCIDSDDYSIWMLDTATAAYWMIYGSQQYAMILWDQANGDEDCDGVPGAGECPCGYSEKTEFRNLMVRGADTGSSEAWVPDDGGESCVGDGSGNDPPCVTQAGRYDDQVTMSQMPNHDHYLGEYPPDGTDTLFTGGAGTVSAAAGAFDTFFDRTWVPEGQDDDHYHPFRTVLVCEKT